jgi:hypothetical protein
MISNEEKKEEFIGINKISATSFSTKFQKNKHNNQEEQKQDINFDEFLSEDAQKKEEEIQRENRRQRIQNIKFENNNKKIENKNTNNNNKGPIIQESYKNLNINNVILKKNEIIDHKSILLKKENNNYLDTSSKNQDLIPLKSKIDVNWNNIENEINLGKKISEELDFIKDNIDINLDMNSINLSIEERQKLLKMVEEEREKSINKSKKKFKLLINYQILILK